jgi:phage portal protein BeeE
LIEQLKWSAETVCSCFGVPPYMVGIGPMPSYNNVEALAQQYYQQCVQHMIEALELCLDEGLGLTTTPNKVYGTEFDLDDLLRMDTATKVKTGVDGLKGLFSPNEVRKKFDLKPVAGGETPYLQEQNWPLRLLADRELPTRAPTAPVDPPPDQEDQLDEEGIEKYLELHTPGALVVHDRLEAMSTLSHREASGGRPTI